MQRMICCSSSINGCRLQSLVTPGGLLAFRRGFPSAPTDPSSPSSTSASELAHPRPKLHWTEEFKIRSPKVPPSRLREHPVIGVDIESDAFADRRVAFVLRWRPVGAPAHPRARGAGKILSWLGLSTLPYLAFCKWAGGTPLLGSMETMAIPATVAGVTLGYLGINFALERAVFSRRIYSVALDDADPSIVYVSTMPVGNWLHGSHRSFVTRLDNIAVRVVSKNWATLSFKSDGGNGESFQLPIGRWNRFVVDARAMAAFTEACVRPKAATDPDADAKQQRSDLKQFDRVVLPTDSEIDRHLEATLTKETQSPADKGTQQQQQ